MNSNSNYLSENSQLVNDSAEWIGNTVFIESDQLIWNNGVPEITVDYSEAISNQTNVENEDYMTAEESCDTTQYFSILDANYSADNDEEQINEDDYNTLIESNAGYVMKVEVSKEESILPDISENGLYMNELSEKLSDGQIMVFDGENNEYYAIQLLDDGTGKIKPYQYKVRQLEDGQFAAVPGTTQLQFIDEDADLELKLDETQECSVKDEAIITDAESDQLSAETLATTDAVNKMENMDVESDSDELNSGDGEVEYLLSEDEDEDEDEGENLFLSGPEFAEHSPEEFEDVAVAQVKVSFSEDTNSDYEDSKMKVYLLEDQLDKNNVYKAKPSNFGVLSNYVKPNVNTQKNNIIKPKLNSVNEVEVKKTHPSHDIKGPGQQLSVKNPRSLLKSNFLVVNSEPKAAEPVYKFATNGKENLQGKCSELQKYLQKPKEPVSKAARPPRKQTIRPVERAGSEIIVQPLYFTRDGRVIESFLEKPSFPSDEVLQVSDSSDCGSDPDYVDKSCKKYRKRGRPRLKIAEITISDSDSDDSVIEIFSEQLGGAAHGADCVVSLDDDTDRDEAQPSTAGRDRTRGAPRCTACGLVALSRAQLRRHRALHLGKCPKRPAGAARPPNRHRKSVGRRGPRRRLFPCASCGVLLRGKLLRDEHVRTHCLSRTRAPKSGGGARGPHRPCHRSKLKS